jgi:hypothetical protein
VIELIKKIFGLIFGLNKTKKKYPNKDIGDVLDKAYVKGEAEDQIKKSNKSLDN